MNIELKIVRHDRMFPFVDAFKYFIEGCSFNCTYCWQRRREYPRKIVPTFHSFALNYPCKDNTTVFIDPNSDTFCDGVKPEWIEQIMTYISKYPRTAFLMMTKNPQAYLDNWKLLPDNVICGATIESNDETIDFYSNAPSFSKRTKAMQNLIWNNKFISIEPIMKFTSMFLTEINLMLPKWVAIGYDNYGYKLPEPTLEETMWLIDEMENLGITVFRKTLREKWDN